MEHEQQYPEAYPLTVLQEGMLLHTQQAPEEGAYVQQFICDLREPLEIDLFMRPGNSWLSGIPFCGPALTWRTSSRPSRSSMPRSMFLGSNVTCAVCR